MVFSFLVPYSSFIPPVFSRSIRKITERKKTRRLCVRPKNKFLGVGRSFATTYALVFFRPFNENFKFPNNCPYDFYKILHGHFTPKGASTCAMISNSYHWDQRNKSKISPNMTKNCQFWTLPIFSNTL